MVKEKIVIYKDIDGRICTTVESNYNAEIQDANKIQQWTLYESFEEVIEYCVKYCGKNENDFKPIRPTKSEKREIAKDLLMESLAVAYYKLVDDKYKYGHLTEEETDEICKYMRQYGDSMGKRIGRNYYTL